MIVCKSEREIKKMRRAGKITANALKVAGESICSGMTTADLDNIIREYILSQNATPSFLNYNGFPGSACISVNNEVIHGIPGKRVINDGDIVSIDVGAKIDGYHGDSAATFGVGKISSTAMKLIEVTEKALYLGIEQAIIGNRIGDIGYAVQSYVEKNGFSVITDFVGHGVGMNLHEDPNVPNIGLPHMGVRLEKGMTLAIEPMINEGTYEINILKNGWTVVTVDGKLSAHFEHTVAVTGGEPEILTRV